MHSTFDDPVDARSVTSIALPSFTDLDRAAWDHIYTDAVEGFDYFRSCEQAPPAMFEFQAFGVREGGKLIAGGPTFSTDFRLDLAAGGPFQRVAQWLEKRAPRLNRVKVLGLGSPHADELGLAFAPELDTAARARALDTLLAGLGRHAQETRSTLIAFKNVSTAQCEEFGEVFARRGYARIATLPISKLAIPASVDAYIDSLSANMRSNIRRKLKRAARLKVEIRKGGASIADVEAELFELRELTRRRASTDYDAFAEVAPGYFASVMAGCGDRARLLLYRLDGRLIAFSIVLLEKSRLKEKYTGMRYPEGPDNGVFFLNWVTLIRLCIEHNIPQLHAGETTYLTKARLGCQFHRSWIYFRHRRPLVNALFGQASRWVSLEAADPDLRELGNTAPFVDALPQR